MPKFEVKPQIDLIMEIEAESQQEADDIGLDLVEGWLVVGIQVSGVADKLEVHVKGDDE